MLEREQGKVWFVGGRFGSLRFGTVRLSSMSAADIFHVCPSLIACSFPVFILFRIAASDIPNRLAASVAVSIVSFGDDIVW